MKVKVASFVRLTTSVPILLVSRDTIHFRAI